jgi:hypothetical protein
MQAQIDEQCVIRANSQFWEQMLAMTLASVPRAEEFFVAAGHLYGCVALTGVWTGRIEVRLAERLAREATAAMLTQPVETVGAADLLDATREIANMIAGLIKSSLPRPCSMAVPEAAIEASGYLLPPAQQDSLAVVFRHGGGDPMMVRVWEQECLQ